MTKYWYQDVEAMGYCTYGKEIGLRRATAVRGIYHLKGDWRERYDIFYNATGNLGIKYGGAAVEKLLGIWVVRECTEYPELPEDIYNLAKGLCGPNAHALLMAYRIKHKLGTP